MTLIDQPYYDWLISQIEFPRNFDKTFSGLLYHLHLFEFVWIIDGDDNRMQDARDLRTEFKRRFPEYSKIEFNDYVSVLEVMIAVSRTLEFVAGGEAPAWVWRLIDNLRLNHFYDPFTKYKQVQVDDILETLIWRTYERNGRGGFFPLIYPAEDQTKVEIWYQLNAYVQEIVQE